MLEQGTASSIHPFPHHITVACLELPLQLEVDPVQQAFGTGGARDHGGEHFNQTNPRTAELCVQSMYFATEN